MYLPYKNNFIITQTFLNPNSHYASGYHLGVDLVGLADKTIYAIQGGTVFSAGYESGFGNTVVIQQPDHYYTRYSHLESIEVKVNQTITPGVTRIGTEGASGFVYGGNDPRHLDLRISKVPMHSDQTDLYINPCEYLDFPNELYSIIQGGISMNKHQAIILYYSEVDKRAALYLSDYLRCATIDVSLLPVEIIDQAFENIYVIGTAQKPVSRAVNILGEDRFETCKKVIDMIANLEKEKYKTNKKGIGLPWKI